MSDSVSEWITAVREGDDQAASRFWERYFLRFTKIADRRLGPSGRRVVDGDDVGLSVMESLFEGFGFTQPVLPLPVSKMPVNMIRFGKSRRTDLAPASCSSTSSITISASGPM